MIPIIDFQKRCLNGPVMKPDEFDLALSMKMRELVDKYNIQYDPEQLIIDDDTADAVFEAGVELLADIGILNQDINRVVRFDKKEIQAVAGQYFENSPTAEFGTGKDKMTIRYRRGNDTNPPTNYAGAPGVTTEEEFIPYVMSIVQEEGVAGLGIAPGLSKLGDMEPKAGTLSEIHVGMWEQEQLKEALRRVDRPGLNLGLLATVSTPSAIFECIRPGIREPNNTQIGIHVLPEQKITWDRFLMAHFCQDRGVNPWQSAMSMIGALCRDARESAVTLVANGLAQLSYGHGPTLSFFSNHMDGRYGWPEPNWAVGAAMRASERNIHVATGSAISGTKWRHEVGMYQMAAQAVTYTACGFSFSWIAGHTGLEARLVGEIMQVTAGMDRAKANALALKITAKYLDLFKNYDHKETHEPFDQCYDIKTVKPRAEYESTVMKVKEDLAKMGIPFQ